MANKAEIKNAILKVAGHPSSGVVFDLAEEWAEAIVALDAPQATASALAVSKETRITKPEETR